MSFKKNGLKISPFAASLSSNPIGIRKIETQSGSDAIKNFRLIVHFLMYKKTRSSEFLGENVNYIFLGS